LAVCIAALHYPNEEFGVACERIVRLLELFFVELGVELAKLFSVFMAHNSVSVATTACHFCICIARL